ncbi:MAG: arsenate reductase ArsC [Deltaproteobacteria bacterium]|nr:arsenate reductase ArsC [Deltaproteobacteria bacterium]
MAGGARKAEGGWRADVEAMRAEPPRQLLFLCVANSARSQMAEGIGRSLAPPAVRISSAGASPTMVRSEAIQVLDEIGIDISEHRAKAVASLADVESVDTVITLCAEEVCPVFLHRARRFHWPLPDPAAVPAGEGRLAAYRAVRDELRRRLEALFAG